MNFGVNCNFLLLSVKKSTLQARGNAGQRYYFPSEKNETNLQSRSALEVLERRRTLLAQAKCQSKISRLGKKSNAKSKTQISATRS